jgi:hypothetical protein
MGNVAGSRPPTSRFCEWVRHGLAPMLFVVGLVTVMHHSVLAPFSHLSLLVLSNVAADTSLPGANSRATIWLLSIDEPDFLGRYEERRPLMRCRLLEDLGNILAGKPKVLAIDLDLSPLPAPTPLEACCQEKLDQLLKNSHTEIVLIRPFPADNPGLREKKSEWMGKLPKASFALPDIDVGVGVAVDFECNSSGLAEMARRAGGSENPCEHFEHRTALDFSAFRKAVFAQSISELLALGPTAEMKGATVFFGIRTGRADRVATPIGSEHGVVVHAARFATLEAGKKPWCHRLLNPILDLMWASLFSFAIFWVMPKYIRLRSQPDPLTPARVTIMLTLFAAGYGAVCVLLVGLATVLAALCGIITEPLLIAIGIGIDGFVLAGWEYAGAPRHAHRPDAAARLPGGWRQRLSQTVVPFAAHPGLGMVELVRWAIFAGVVGLASKYVIGGLMR